MYTLRCTKKVFLNGSSTDLNLHVFTRPAELAKEFELMCAAIDNDIESAEGSGAIGARQATCRVVKRPEADYCRARPQR